MIMNLAHAFFLLSNEFSTTTKRSTKVAGSTMNKLSLESLGKCINSIKKHSEPVNQTACGQTTVSDEVLNLDSLCQTTIAVAVLPL